MTTNREDDLGPLLALARGRLGLSQAQAAQKLGISQAYVAQIEGGRRPASDVEVRVRRFVAGAERKRSRKEDRDVDKLIRTVRRRPELTENPLGKALGMPKRRLRRALAAAVGTHIDRRWAPGGASRRMAWRFFPAAAESSMPERWSGDELKRRLVLASMRGAELARRVDVTPGAVAKWKREGPPLGRMGELVAIFEAPPTSQDILEAIEHAGWSQSEFARRVGVSRALVRAWLRGVPVSEPRRDAVRQTISDARNVEAPGTLSTREALLDLLDDHPGGLRRTELRDWRGRYKLGREDAAREIDDAVNAGQAHWEQDFIDVGDHKRVVQRLVRGPVSEGTEAPQLSGSELERLRKGAELSRREAAELLDVPYPTYVNWENDGPVHRTRVVEIRRTLEKAASGTTSLDKKVREIARVVSRHPDISRTELFERYVGDSQLAHRALDRALDDERVHEGQVELVGRQPYQGLRVGPAIEPADGGSPLTGVTLKERRERIGVLQIELAQAIGVSTPAISRWEHRARIPSRFHQPVEEFLADAERRSPERAAKQAQAAADRALSSVIDGISRRPGISREALLDRLSRPGVPEALGLALEAGQVHEERQTVQDRVGRPHVRVGLHPGRGSEVGPPPDPIDPTEIRSVRQDAGLSQREFGELVGVSQATVTGWERTTPVPVGRREALRGVLDELRGQHPGDRRRLPRADVPSVAQLVEEHPGVTRGRLLVRVNAKRRERLAGELAEAIARGDVHERRAVVDGRERVELHPGPPTDPVQI